MKKTIFLMIVFVFFAFKVFLPPFTMMQDKKQRNLEYQNRIYELKEKQVQLIEEKRRLQEDPEYLEKVARNKMGLIREGEVVYRILPNTRTFEEE